MTKRPGNDKRIGLNFCFASDWFGGWCKFFGPITELCKAKAILDDTQLQFALPFSKN